MLTLLLFLAVDMAASNTPTKCSTHAKGQASASSKNKDGQRLIFFTSGQYLYQMKVRVAR